MRHLKNILGMPTLTGQNGKILAVNSGENGFEFISPSQGGVGSEADTLATVTGRGAVTSAIVTVGGVIVGQSNVQNYTSNLANDALKVSGNSLKNIFGVQNLNASGISGVEFIGSDGNSKGAFGYNNATAGEFRFNNTAASAHFDFLIANVPVLSINNDATVSATNDIIVSANANRKAKLTNDGIYFSETTGGTYASSITGAANIIYNTTGNHIWMLNGLQAMALFANGHFNFNSLTDGNVRFRIVGASMIEGAGSTTEDAAAFYIKNTTASTGKTFRIESTDAGLFKIIDVSAAESERLSVSGTGTLRVASLSGTGTRMVVVDDNGNLNTQAVPGNGQSLPLLTAGSIPYSNGTTLAEDNANLFWDATNKRLGVGTNVPAWNVHFKKTTNDLNPVGLIEDTKSTGYVMWGVKGTGIQYNWGVGNAGETFFSVANKFFIFDVTNNIMRMVVDSNGKVGIGTVNPTKGLTVISSSADQGTIRVGATTTNYVDLGYFNSSARLQSNVGLVVQSNTALLLTTASTNSNITMTPHGTGKVIISPLIGTGTRMVVVNADGSLGEQSIPTSSGGQSNAYVNISDGITTANSSGADTIKFRAVDNKISVVVGSNDATHGDNVLIGINEQNLVIAQSQVTGLITDLAAKVAANVAITGGTKTKITYDAKGLVTAGTDATTTDILEGSNLYFTDARVRGTALTGYVVGTNTALVATDTLLAAFQKLQGQINARLSSNQTITLTGNITGSGTTSIATTIANAAVTYAKIQNVSATSRILGRHSAGAGSIEEITIGSGLQLSGGILSTSGTGGLTAAYTAMTDGVTTTTTTGAATFKFRTANNILGLTVTENDATHGDNILFTLNQGNIILAQSQVTNLTSDLSSKVTGNALISGATKTKITYDAKGLVTGGADATTSDIGEGSNLYFTQARVADTVLSGFVVGTNATVANTDTVVLAIGKIQAQLNAKQATFGLTSANRVFAGPTTGTAAPAFRLLVEADIPSLDASKIGSGNIAIARLAAGTATEGYVVKVVGGVATWAEDAMGLSTVHWDNVTNKPTSFAPSAHFHNAADINSGTFSTARLANGTAVEGYVLKIVAGSPTWAADSVGNTSFGTLQDVTTEGDTTTHAISVGGLILPNMTIGSIPYVGAGGSLTQNNSNLFYNAATNRLGFGTNVPSWFVHYKKNDNTFNPVGVVEDLKANGYVMWGIKGTGVQFNWGVGNAQEVWYDVPNKFFIFDVTNDVMRMVINSSGNMGVGTVNPTHRLHVNGGVRFDLGGDATYDLFYRGASGNLERIAKGTNGQVLKMVAGAPAWSTDLNDSSGQWVVNGTDMYYTGGNVGIGATVLAPSATLHVSGSVRFDVGTDATGDIYYRDASGNLARLPIGSNGQVLKIAGGLPGWGTDNEGTGGTGAVTSVFGRTGSVVANAGDYNTGQVTEGSNLYFTEARVRTSVLTGYVVGANATLAATDTLLAALGKIQGQLNSKQASGSYEPAIAAGTTVKYWRGDKTWQTLDTNAVSEGSNLYYTDARVRSATITGYALGSNAALVATDTILSAFGKIQAQLNAKLSANQTITLSGNITGSGTTAITTTIANAAVTYAKIQNVSAANRLLGRFTTGAGSVEEITIGSGLTLTGGVLEAAGGTSGLSAAYTGMTDGTNTSTTSGATTFKFRSASNLLTVLVTNDDATHGDNLLLTVNQTNIVLAQSQITGLTTSLAAKLDKNTAITGATKTKITYDADGLVTAGADLVETDIPALSTAKITSGTFASARLAGGTASEGFVVKIVGGTPTWSADVTGSSGGLSNAYAAMTDGTNSASASGGDAFKFRSANNLLSLVVTSNDATHGNNILFTINQANIVLAQSQVTNLTTTLAGKLDKNTAITAATRTKITYDANGLVTGGASLVEADIPALSAAKITSGSFNAARLASGTVTEGYMIKIVGGVPTWTVAPTGGTGGGTFYVSNIDFSGDPSDSANPLRLKHGNGFTDPGMNGFMVRNAANTLIPRILTQGTGIVVTNGDGILQDPVIAVSSTVLQTTTTQTMTNKTLGSGTKVAIGSDATGDMYYRNSGGLLTKLNAGLEGTVLRMGAGSTPQWVSPSVASQSWIVKQRTTSVGFSTNAVLTNDPVLNFTATAGKVYTVRITVHFNSTGSNFKFGINGPSAIMRGTRTLIMNGVTTTYSHLTNYDTTGQTVTGNGTGTVIMNLTIDATATGTVYFTCCQGTSGSAPTTLYEGSTLEYYVVD